MSPEGHAHSTSHQRHEVVTANIRLQHAGLSRHLPAMGGVVSRSPAGIERAVTCMQLSSHTENSATAFREKITSSLPQGSCTVLHQWGNGINPGNVGDCSPFAALMA